MQLSLGNHLAGESPDVLERMVSGRTKAHELERLLPWAWKAEQLAAAVDA
jgi:hypothetical protein